MGRHNQKPESTTPIRPARRPAPRPIKTPAPRDFLTWPMMGLTAAVALVLGVLIGMLIG